MLAHEVAQFHELVFAERAIFVFVEPVEQPLGIWWSWWAIVVGTARWRTARATLIGTTPVWSATFRTALAAWATSAFMSTIVTIARRSGRWTVWPACFAIAWRRTVGSTSFGTTSPVSPWRADAEVFMQRAADFARFGAVDRAVVIVVKRVEQLLLHRWVGRRAIAVARPFGRLSKCRQ